MQAIRLNDDMPLTLGRKVTKTAPTDAEFDAATQASFRELFETLDWGLLVGIRERDCQQKAARLPQASLIDLSDDQIAELVEMRGGCNCHIRPPCFACSEPLKAFELLDLRGC